MDTVLPQTTITGQGEFDAVFTEVASPIKSSETAGGVVRLFHVNVRSSQFDYRALCNLLTANVGGYVFSRAQMLLYTFLEHVLEAPKVLSKFELENLSGQQRSNADAIHILPAGTSGATTYIVLGAAYVEANLHDSIHTAISRIRQIRNDEELECQIVDSTALDKEFSTRDAKMLSRLIIPSKVSQDKEICYAMFIGYSLGLTNSSS